MFTNLAIERGPHMGNTFGVTISRCARPCIWTVWAQQLRRLFWLRHRADDLQRCAGRTWSFFFGWILNGNNHGKNNVKTVFINFR